MASTAHLMRARTPAARAGRPATTTTPSPPPIAAARTTATALGRATGSSSRCAPPPPRAPRRRSVASRAVAGDIDPDNASVLVCGGGGVALEVARRLKDAGAWVWMLQRSDIRRAEIEKMMAVVIRGDATSKSDVDAAFAQIEDVDLVVSTIGGTPADPTADSTGNINLIEAAAAKGVRKFVLVTSIGCGDSRDAPPRPVYDVLQPVLVEKDKAEAALRASGMAYTIIRPGGLANGPATGSAVLTADAGVCGAVQREDAAALIVQAALKGRADNRVLSVVDTAQLFAKDGVVPAVEAFVM